MLKTSRPRGLKMCGYLDSDKRLANHCLRVSVSLHHNQHMILSYFVNLMDMEISFIGILLYISPIRVSLSFLSYVCWKLGLNSFNSLIFIEITYIHIIFSFITLLPY